MNTKILLVAASTLLFTGCSTFSDDDVVAEKQPYTHPVPKPSPYKVIERNKERVKHIFVFEFNSSKLPEDAKNNIQPHANYLISNPNKKVSVQGSADSSGGKGYNHRLGEKRAKNIAQLLVELGVEPAQLVVTSAGEARSLYIPSRSVILAY
ncbi:OmpA family protein [Colwellia sp. MSW7]|uniref:OmpA family protein n=1 Tax=Colwellia maritima TaxID=2912588 RepID=A0ABS9X709_9GAMM|nr:OmpA family protein [Colwellia maritima]MCI2286018.1 OmpA family protein [Colwellia maritima]